MISPLAKGDYEDMVADGLKPTLEDFDRLNTIALRLTNGGETTAANFPRVGWAGDVPFHQPTCAAFAWYLQFAERPTFGVEMKDACWFYALANGRKAGAFDGMESATDISSRVGEWLKTLPVTRGEIARACRYAVSGYDDAEAAKPPAKVEEDAKKREAEKRQGVLDCLNGNITTAAALTGIAPNDLMTETPSRLRAMVEAVRNEHGVGADESQLRADYDLTFREIRMRLVNERDSMTKERGDGE